MQLLAIVSLALVIVIGSVSYGAKLGFQVAGINVQPSELVKIVFVFFVASSFKQSMAFKDIVVTTALAAFHVLILVASKDLGAALIIFVVYLVMLYVATRQPLYVLAGLGAGSVASVGAYYLFNHVRNVWSPGKIRLLHIAEADIRWHSLYLQLEQEAGSVWDCSRDSQIRFLLHRQILSFLQSARRWG